MTGTGGPRPRWLITLFEGESLNDMVPVEAVGDNENYSQYLLNTLPAPQHHSTPVYSGGL